MSGQNREPCFTSTSPAWRASIAPGMRSPASAVLGWAIEHFAALGLKAPEAVMSDNAFAYRKSNAFRDQLAAHGARHILTPPYTPRWNGKVERFIQT